MGCVINSMASAITGMICDGGNAGCVMKGLSLIHIFMGLGIKREIIGDILVREDGADIVILKEMENFLLSHYAKAGRVYLSAEILPLEKLWVPEVKTVMIKDTVASLRLDNVKMCIRDR